MSEKIMRYAVMALPFALILVPMLGTGDVGTWMKWKLAIDKFGIVGGYQWYYTDYPPLSFVILALGDVKVLIFAMTVLSLYLFHRLHGEHVKLLHAYFAVIIASMYGYIDVFYLPALLLTFYYIRKNLALPAIIFATLAALIKPQPLLLIPFVLIYFRKEWRLTLPVMSAMVAFTVMVFSPQACWRSFAYASHHPYLSGNAMNFNWLITVFSTGKYEFVYREFLPSRIIFAGLYILYAVSFWRSERKFEDFMYYGGMGILAYFLFNVGVHENHAYIAAAMFLFLRNTAPSLMLNTNILMMYTARGFMPELTVAVSAVNLIVFAVIHRRAIEQWAYRHNVKVFLTCLNADFLSLVKK